MNLLPAFVIALREGLEVALVVGIVLGALQKMGHPELKRSVWLGAAAAAVISLLFALVLEWLGKELEGAQEAIFEGLTLLLAAAVLSWMIFWMQRQARFIKGELENGVRRAMQQHGRERIFLLAFTAVLRESVELALLLVAATLGTNLLETVSGAVLGLALASTLGWMLFSSLVRLNLGRFFSLTGALLILFAAGLVAHAAGDLVEAGWIPALVRHVWDLGKIFSDSSLLGQVFSALFGYTSSPSLAQVLAYLSYYLLIAIGLWRIRLPRPTSQKA